MAEIELFLLLHAFMEQIRTFVAKRAMSRICAFLVLFGLRFDSDISDLTQISGQKKTVKACSPYFKDLIGTFLTFWDPIGSQFIF